MTVRFWAEDSLTNFRGPSVQIFGDLSKLQQDAWDGKCVLYYNDFVAPPTIAVAGTQVGELYGIANTGAAITGKGINDIGKELGVLQIKTLDADNEEGLVQIGRGNQWRISNSSGNTGKIMYEVRYAVNELGADDVATAVGLFEGDVALASLDDNTGEIVDSKSFIGFRSLNTDPQHMDIVYQDTGSTAVNTVLANAATLVANTYVRLGLKYDPAEDDAHKITYYVNGSPVAYTNTTYINGTKFPEDEGMVPMFGAKAFSGVTSGAMSVDEVTFCAYMNAIDG